MEALKTFAGYAGDICAIAACVSLCCKPIREKLFGISKAVEGQKCLLRAEILRTYYRNLDSKHLREYEYTNLSQCYDAYIALGGNSFIKKIYAEMQEWDIVP